MYPWFKFYIRKTFDTTYFWFYVNNRTYSFRLLVTDLKLLFFSFLNWCEGFFVFGYLVKFKTSFFFYWTHYNLEFHFDGFRKHYIKNQIISSLIN